MNIISKFSILIGLTSCLTSTAQVNNDLAHAGINGKVQQYSEYIFDNVVKKNGHWIIADTTSYTYSITDMDGDGNMVTKSYYKHYADTNLLIAKVSYINNRGGSRTGYMYTEFTQPAVRINIGKADSTHYTETINDGLDKHVENKTYTLNSQHRIINMDRYFAIAGTRGYRKDYVTEVRGYDSKGHLVLCTIIAKEQGTDKADTTKQWQYLIPFSDDHNNPLRIERIEKGNDNNTRIFMYGYKYSE